MTTLSLGGPGSRLNADTVANRGLMALDSAQNYNVLPGSRIISQPQIGYTPFFECGFECQLAGAGHWLSAIGTAPTLSSTIFYGSGTSLHTQTAAATSYLNSPNFASTSIVTRFRLYFVTLPDATTSFHQIINANGTVSIKVAANGAARIAIGTSGDINTGVTLVTGRWYRFDVVADSSGAIATASVTIDGGSATNAASTQTSANFTSIRAGTVTTCTTDAYIDDVSASTTLSDFPLGDYHITALQVQTVSGTHARQVAGDFLTDSSGSITNGDNSGAKLQDLPPDLTSYIQLTTADTGYVEYLYGGPPAAVAPNSVTQIVVVSNISGVGLNNEKSQLFDGTTAADAYALTNVGSASAVYRQKLWTQTPSATPWDANSYNNLRLRWGFSSSVTSSTPFVTASVIEGAFPSGPLATVSNTFTADAVLKATIAATFTADAVLLKTFSGTFTADATLLQTQTGSIASDAVLFKTLSGSLTSDADLKKTISGSFTADAYLSTTPTGSFTSDAVIKATISATFTSDAVLKKTLTGTFTSDAVLLKTISGSFTSDADIKATISSSFTSDADLKATISGSFTSDALIVKTFSGSFTSDAVVKKTISATFTSDADIKATMTGSVTSDAVLFKTLSGTFTSDSVIRKTLSGTFTSDAEIKAEEDGSFTSDAVILKTQVGFLTSDAVLRKTLAGSFTSDAQLLITVSGAITADAVLKRTQVFSFTADGVLKATASGNLTADAVLLKTFIQTFISDATILKTSAGSFAADGTIRKTQSGTFTSDAIVGNLPTSVFGVTLVTPTLQGSTAPAPTHHGSTQSAPTAFGVTISSPTLQGSATPVLTHHGSTTAEKT